MTQNTGGRYEASGSRGRVLMSFEGGRDGFGGGRGGNDGTRTIGGRVGLGDDGSIFFIRSKETLGAEPVNEIHDGLGEKERKKEV